MSNLDALVSRYTSSVPRYTSYPTAVEFLGSFRGKEWRAALQRESFTANPATSLYVHIPFCRSLCFFCACSKEITRNYDVVAPYLEAIGDEVASYREIGGAATIEQLHWGGGSPNFLAPTEMIRLFSGFKATFTNFSDDAEISLEMDPRATSAEQLTVARELGFNRVSFGVQDFDAVVQGIVNRKQPFQDTAKLTEVARRLNFSSVSYDLIYGLPGQTQESWQRTLKSLTELRPDRIALYGYAHVTWRTKAQESFERRAELPSPRQRIDLFLAARERLLSVGYIPIGLDHFALPHDSLAEAVKDGSLNRNFMGYSTHAGKRVIGFGPSAISSLESAYAQNEVSVETYQARVRAEGSAVSRGLELSRDDLIRRAVIEELMCLGTIDIGRFKSVWQVDFASYFAEELRELAKFRDDELLAMVGDQIRLSEMGALFARPIAATFDSYLHRHLSGDQRVFSQSL